MNKQVTYILGFLLGAFDGLVVGKTIYTGHPERGMAYMLVSLAFLVVACMVWQAVEKK